MNRIESGFVATIPKVVKGKYKLQSRCVASVRHSLEVAKQENLVPLHLCGSPIGISLFLCRNIKPKPLLNVNLIETLVSKLRLDELALTSEPL
jgi:hypothetical protein